MEISLIEEQKYLTALKNKFDSYSPIGEETWGLLQSIITFVPLQKDELLIRHGEVAKQSYFICKGIVRAYFTDEEGDIYTKNIFLENDWAGSTVSSLLQKPSKFTLDALEDSLVIVFNHKKYRDYIFQQEDLKNFYIAYLEKNWVIDKEQREVSLVLEDATKRYLKLLSQHPDIESRICQHHVASNLGITPTQLSRIRKSLKKA